MKEKMHSKERFGISSVKWLTPSVVIYCFTFCGLIHPNEKDKQVKKDDEAKRIEQIGYLIVCLQPGSLNAGSHVSGDIVPMAAIGGFMGVPSGCIHKELNSGFIYNYDTNVQLSSPITAGQNLVCKCSSSVSNSDGSWFKAPALVNPPGLNLTFVSRQNSGPFVQYAAGDFLVCVPSFNGCPNQFQYQIVGVQ